MMKLWMDRSVLRNGVAGLLVMVMAACSRPVEPSAAEPMRGVEGAVAMTSFYPLTYFAQRIGGEAVTVRCPVPDDADPAMWSPTPADISAMQAAGVVLINGASFEKWVATAPLARSRLVDTTAGLGDQLLKYEHATTHSHGPGGSHSHEGVDGHTWLDPVIAIAQAEAVRDGLTGAFPEHESAFTRGCAELAVDLRRLDAELKELSAEMDDVVLICSHPAYNYLARRYGWNILNVDVPPEEPIDEEVLESLAGSNLRVKRIVLWESAPLPENELALSARLGAASVLFSPCESPAQADYVQRMRENIGRLRAALGDG